MLTRIACGRVIDPANGRDDVGDVWMRDGRIVNAPGGRARADATYDAAGKIVMAGAIDIHSHIAGWNVNTARLLLPELHRAAAPRPAAVPSANAPWSTFGTGCLYAAMGFTTVVEPAVSPHYALHAHLELADIPIIDKATLTVLGNDDYLLSLLHAKESDTAVEDYVAWTLEMSRGLGVKVVNAGGAAAFKENARAFFVRRCRTILWCFVAGNR
jgi:formylmethanofuran dehydrogenase subunit A